MKKIIKSYEPIYKRGFIHRDLKSENILFKKVNGVYEFKIGDFGLARFKLDKTMSTGVGDMKYMAP